MDHFFYLELIIVFTLYWSMFLNQTIFFFVAHKSNWHVQFCFKKWTFTKSILVEWKTSHFVLLLMQKNKLFGVNQKHKRSSSRCIKLPTSKLANCFAHLSFLYLLQVIFWTYMAVIHELSLINIFFVHTCSSSKTYSRVEIALAAGEWREH